MATNAVDSQLIEQLKWTAEIVASTYHVPPYKIGVGQMPTYNNIQSLNVEYYSQALQRLIEDAELCLDEGLGIGLGNPVSGSTYGTEFDLDNLLRMDSVTQMDVLDKAAGKMTVDEMRAKINLPPTVGGSAVYLQQQNYSLAALAKRDAQEDPFGANPPAPPAAPPANDNPDQARAMIALFEKDLREALNA
jgi:phage portal protein BeeE